MTSPTIGRLSGGPWRHGVAVISIVGRPTPSTAWSPSVEPLGVPPRRAAPDEFVTTTPAEGRSARPASSRLSPWWSWLTQHHIDRPDVLRGDAGPVLRELVPQPKA